MKLQLFIGRLQDLYAQYGDVEVFVADASGERAAFDFAPSIADDPQDGTRKIVVIR